jgi:Ca-activated chloride channel family protein
VQNAIDRIYEGGGTNLYAGLSVGREELRRSFDGESVGRLVLLSDGMANMGITDPDAIARFSAQMASEGLTVSAIGLGVDYNEDLLARVADLGGGTYDFVDDPRELELAFQDELERSASVVARKTRVDVDLPAGVRLIEVLGWETGVAKDGRFSVHVGDVYAGEERKIVMRVTVAGATTGEMPIAKATAAYEDVIDGTAGLAQASVVATVTADQRVVEKSVDKQNAVESARAWGNTFLDRSARAFSAGKVEEAKQLATKGGTVMRENAAALNEPTLAMEAAPVAAQTLLYDALAPSSDEGKQAVKKAKESARDATR